VTKAALYYHFKSKDEIVSSFAEDRLRRLDEIIEWAQAQPPGPERRQELLSRYADEFFASNHPSVMRFFEQNQTVVKTMSAGIEMRDRIMRVATLMADDADGPEEQLRGALALFAVHGSWFAIKSDIPIEERKRVALSVAEDLWRPRVSS
jgi:AcrR family transcriptional regulator